MGITFVLLFSKVMRLNNTDDRKVASENIYHAHYMANLIEDEIRRIANSDPRLILNTVKSYVQDNGILIEIELAVAPFNDAAIVNVFFNNLTNQATLQT